MQLISEYLERAVLFERMAGEADTPALRERLTKVAAEYRQLAEKKAAGRALRVIGTAA